MNEVVEAELYAIDNQDGYDLFCIGDDSEDDNYLLIVPEEENNYTKMEKIDCLDNIQPYLNNDMQHSERNMVDALKYITQARHLQKPNKPPSVSTYFSKSPK